MSLDQNFETAAAQVKTLNKTPDDGELLTIYALYKQAKFGDCNIDKPLAIDLKGCAKWTAWSERKGVSKDDAKTEYIAEVNKLVEKYGTK